MIMQVSVSIIIPIFNAYDELQKCIESVLRYTDSDIPILLMDDASSDPRVSTFLRSVDENYANISVHTSQLNQGFVVNCNKAFNILQHDHDCVLLNSDVIVTKNWLYKLIRAAYISDDIGTVTPLTNNGTICSVPVWLENNRIPEGLDIDSFANLVELVSLHQYPELPTAVGFCMYIKRNVLNEVGYFNESAFGRGYGEENDFSSRVISCGYKNIVDDSTFVYHAGGKSFGEENKDDLILHNLKILSKIHPDYSYRVSKFIESKPLEQILKNINLAITIYRARESNPFLYLLHNDPCQPINNPIGGTEYHSSLMIDSFKYDQFVLVLYRNRHDSYFYLKIFNKSETLLWKLNVCVPSSHYLDDSKEYYWLVNNIISAFNVALIHVHHCIGHPILSLKQVLRDCSVPYVISLHDYYLICPSYNLLDYTKQFCFARKSASYCRICSQSLFSQGSELRTQWKINSYFLMEKAAKIICPSKSCKDYFSKEFTALASKFEVIEHGIYSELNLPIQQATDKSLSLGCQSLSIAVVGALDYKKGSELLRRTMETIETNSTFNSRVVFHFFGIENLEGYVQSPLAIFHGRYTRNDLPSLLKNIDVALFTSIWPETYCLAAYEVLACGLPVITTPYGAIQDTISEYQVGWITKNCSAEFIIAVIDTLLNNPDEIKLKKDNVRNFNTRTLESMNSDYRSIYSQLLQKIDPQNNKEIHALRLFLNSELFYPSQVLDILPEPGIISLGISRTPLSEKHMILKLAKQKMFPIWDFLRKQAIKKGLIT